MQREETCNCETGKSSRGYRMKTADKAARREVRNGKTGEVSRRVKGEG
jgi:hypothetical protein